MTRVSATGPSQHFRSDYTSGTPRTNVRGTLPHLYLARWALTVKVGWGGRAPLSPDYVLALMTDLMCQLKRNDLEPLPESLGHCQYLLGRGVACAPLRYVHRAPATNCWPGVGSGLAPTNWPGHSPPRGIGGDTGVGGGLGR
jgi:hypothetical protein